MGAVQADSQSMPRPQGARVGTLAIPILEVESGESSVTVSFRLAWATENPVLKKVK